MARLLLILPTETYRADAFLAAAERLGLEVAVGSERAQALAAAMGERFLELPLDEPPEAARRIVAQARRQPALAFDAVVAVDDEGLLTAALASAELGLRHHPPGAVALTRDKAAMRAAFAAAGVPQPAYEVVAGHEPASVAAAAERLGYPVVVKPCSLAASRGVIRADSAGDALAAAGRIRPILEEAGEPPDAPLLVEEFVPGPEVAVEGLCRDGEVEIVTIFDKPDQLSGPFFEETLYLSPTELDDALAGEVVELTREAVAALGLTDGPFHAELRVPGALAPGAGRPHGPAARLLEVAARTIGGRCSKALLLEGGTSLEELVITNALGRPHPPPRLASPCGVLMIPIPASGTLAAVEGVSEVRGLPGITGVEITIPIGRPVRALPEGDRYLGFVFAAGRSRDEVEGALRAAERLLVVEVRPAGTDRQADEPGVP